MCFKKQDNYLEKCNSEKFEQDILLPADLLHKSPLYYTGLLILILLIWQSKDFKVISTG